MADFNVCECKCHNENGPKVLHCVPCCYTCETCNQRIKSSFSYAHERACKKEHCQHNWVMDGHNAGDPICSKCYARE